MKKRQTVTIYGLTWSMPIVLWQLVFFVFPLLFLLLMNGWDGAVGRCRAVFVYAYVCACVCVYHSDM